MRHLWLLWLPLVYLPSFGYGVATANGVIELSDYLIGPLMILTCLAGRRRGRLLLGELTPMLLCFLGWALLSTSLVRDRYGYPTYQEVVFGVLKLGKFALYSTAGLLAARAVADEKDRGLFMWSLLIAGVVIAATLFQFSGRHYWVQDGKAVEGYKANNGISVLMAMLLCYLGGMWLSGWGSYRWRSMALPAMIAMALGFFLSEGRGGWVAGLVGSVYLLYRRGLKARVIFALAACVIVTVVSYQTIPSFRSAIKQTIHADANDLATDSDQMIKGFDDGGRMAIGIFEGSKFIASPLLGTGFYHRGGASGLHTTGSHNFFIQMFLETGAVGGLLVIAVLCRMWRHAGSESSRAAGQEVPLRAALIAVIVGGLSGEYFYGSTPLLGLFLIYAQVGAMPEATPQAITDGWLLPPLEA